VLGAVRISGAVLFQAEFRAPWALASPATRLFAPMFVAHARRMILFHIIAEGHCFAEAEGSPPLELAAGDILVLPYGDALAMGDRPGQAPEPVLPLLPPLPWSQPPVLRHGGSGDMTRIVCGFLHADEALLHPMLARMPPMLRIRWGQDQHRLQGVVGYVIEEASAARPGAACLLTRLADIMFVEILRQYAEQQGDGDHMLAALRDPVVGRALALIHSEPARRWTVDDLADRVAASRSAFADHFNRLLGVPPIQYLAQWRIQLAARQLADTTASVAAIAARIGYESEPAFSRAFKRHTGVPPAAWRRQRMGAGAS
jgi:AraC-like DNA-binding protein